MTIHSLTYKYNSYYKVYTNGITNVHRLLTRVLTVLKLISLSPELVAQSGKKAVMIVTGVIRIIKLIHSNYECDKQLLGSTQRKGIETKMGAAT